MRNDEEREVSGEDSSIRLGSGDLHNIEVKRVSATKHTCSIKPDRLTAPWYFVSFLMSQGRRRPKIPDTAGGNTPATVENVQLPTAPACQRKGRGVISEAFSSRGWLVRGVCDGLTASHFDRNGTSWDKTVKLASAATMMSGIVLRKQSSASMHMPKNLELARSPGVIFAFSQTARRKRVRGNDQHVARA